MSTSRQPIWHFILILIVLSIVEERFSTATATSCTSQSSSSSYDFGSCPDPGLRYGYDIDGSGGFGYVPSNRDNFPHAWSPDVAVVESYICHRLANACQADSEAVAACQSAFWQFSGLTGDTAVNHWNSALGVSESVDCTESSSSYNVASVTKTEASYGLATQSGSSQTSTSDSSTSGLSSSGPQTKSHLTSSISQTSTLISAATSSTSTTVTSPTNVALGSVTSSTTETVSRTATSEVTQSPSQGSSGGGGSPFDSQSGVADMRSYLPMYITNLLLLISIYWHL